MSGYLPTDHWSRYGPVHTRLDNGTLRVFAELYDYAAQTSSPDPAWYNISHWFGEKFNSLRLTFRPLFSFPRSFVVECRDVVASLANVVGNFHIPVLSDLLNPTCTPPTLFQANIAQLIRLLVGWFNAALLVVRKQMLVLLKYFYFRPLHTLIALLLAHYGRHLLTKFIHSTWARLYLSKILAQTNVVSSNNVDAKRMIMRDLPLPVVRDQKWHTHPHSAACRSAATVFCRHFAANIGTVPYFLQMSQSDIRAKSLGTRTYYWSKDVVVEPRVDELPRNALKCLIDVDYYLPMQDVLSDNTHPVLIYAFQPDQTSKVTDEYAYTFDCTGRVLYNVTGGARYTHHVWNYSHDGVYAASSYLGLAQAVTYYLVERRKSSPDHELILLLPVGTWRWPYSVLAHSSLGCAELCHLNPVVDKQFLRLMIFAKGGVKISTSKVGSYLCSVVGATTDDAIGAAVRTMQYPVTLPVVLGYMPKGTIKDLALPLLEYHRLKISHAAQVVHPVDVGARNYQYDILHFDCDAKAATVPFMHPIINSAFCPARNLASEVVAVRERLQLVAPPVLPLTKLLSQYMLEFVSLLVPDHLCNVLHPVDMDEVMNRMDRPAQRRKIMDGEHIGRIGMISSFLKGENYQKIAAPRLISVMPSPIKRDYSAYIYAAEVYIKKQKWYAFSKTPRRIANRVVDVLSAAQFAVNTDFSKFDGHGSNIMRELESMYLLRAFALQYHDDLLELHRLQYGVSAFGAYGTKYSPGFARASGSPETSLFNSLTNAFVAYCALRHTVVQGQYLSQQLAFDALGIYGGDDGLTADVSPEIYTWAAKLIGQELTAERIERGALGIKFLARIYGPDVWVGDPNTCCDLPRQLGKLHLSVRLPANVTPIMKLGEKLRCFALTDSNTPIIGPLCTRYKYLTGQHDIPLDPRLAPLTPWWAIYDMENQYYNHPSDWYFAYVVTVLPDFDFDQFTQWLVHLQRPGELLSAPLLMEPPVPVADLRNPVVIEDQIYPDGAPMQPMQEAKVEIVDTDLATLVAPPVENVVGPVRPISKFPVYGPQPRRGNRRQRPREPFHEFKRRRQAAGTWHDLGPGHLPRPPDRS